MKRPLAGILFVLALLAVSVFPATSSAATNLLANPGFEDGGGSYNGWFTFGAGVQLSLPAGDNIIHTGAAASKVYGEFTGCPGSPQFDVGGFGQAFTPTAGQIYELSGYSFVSSGDPIPGTDTCVRNRMIAKIVFFNAAVGGAELSSNEIIIGDGNTVTDHWHAFSVSAPAPAGALRVEALFLFLQPACDGGSVFVDDASFTESAPASVSNLLADPSFSSGLTGWSTFGNVYPDSRSFAVRTPTGSAKLYSTFTPDSPSGMFQSFAATPGSAWQLSAYALTTCVEDAITGSNDNYVLARIVFRDSGGIEVGSTDTVVLDNTAPLGTWTKHTVIAVNAPAGTATVEPYLLFISPTLMDKAAWVDDVSFQELDPTGVGDDPRPLAFELHQNAPNPFSLSTRVAFDLEAADAVNLEVYDIAGRLVRTLFQGRLSAGPHAVAWDGTTASGARAATGIYRYRLRTSAGEVSRNMILIR